MTRRRPRVRTGVICALVECTPPVIRAAIGDTVTWTNGDDFAHTSTSDSDAWDTGPIEPGARATHTFTGAGAFAYFCNIHNSMQGQVIVE
jgi:plastocyanin